jgi:hypothetical protein
MTSLRMRLLLALLAMLAIAAAVMGGVTYRSVLAESRALFDYQLRQMALSLRDQGEIAPDQARAFADEDLDFVVQIWTVDGRSIYASRQHTDLPARALLGLADVSAGGQTWRTFSVATPDRVIQVAQPVLIRQRLAANAALRTVTPLLLLAPVMAFVVWWVAALTLRPLRELAADVRRRGEQSLEPLPARALPEEVSPLVNALNALLQRLSLSLDTQRAFVSDAAHELRSPLTALKLQLQLLKRASDDAARGAAIDALAAGVDRATRLVEQLLALARSEPGAPPAAMERLDLSEMVRDAVAATLPLAVARRLELELFAEGPVRSMATVSACRRWCAISSTTACATRRTGFVWSCACAPSTARRSCSSTTPAPAFRRMSGSGCSTASIGAPRTTLKEPASGSRSCAVWRCGTVHR